MVKYTRVPLYSPNCGLLDQTCQLDSHLTWKKCSGGWYKFSHGKGILSELVGMTVTRDTCNILCVLSIIRTRNTTASFCIVIKQSDDIVNSRERALASIFNVFLLSWYRCFFASSYSVYVKGSRIMNLNLKAESYVNLGNLCKVHTVNVWQLDYMIVRNKKHNSFCLVIKQSDDIVNSI